MSNNNLDVPELQSVIPAHLLDKLTDHERYIVVTLSKLEQQNAWLIRNLVSISKAGLLMETRVSGLERWKERLTSKWAVVAAILLLAAPILVKVALEKLFR